MGRAKASNTKSKSNTPLSQKTDDLAELYKCEPTSWLWMPKPIRDIIARVSMTCFALCFLSIPLMTIFFIPAVWRYAPYSAGTVLGLLVLSWFMPAREWKGARVFGQLWYETLDFSSNLSPERRSKAIKDGKENVQYIIGMHPHGIVPFHAVLWAAFCDQYLSNESNALYGFGAAADVVMYIPLLRNVMGWLSAGSASYKALLNGLTKGVSPPVNAAGRKPRHLYILPGGIAEVFTSTPGRNVVVFKNRYGLCRLSLETGAQLMPCYVFGGTDFFHNLATNEGSFFSSISRKFRAGVTIFWGHFGLPIPFTPKVTLCVADPIPVVKFKGEGRIPQDQIEELHAKYIASIQDLFDKYKAAAGYPEAVLEIK